MRPSWRAAVSTVVAVKVPGTAAPPGWLAACRRKSPSVAVISGPGEQFADARRMLGGALARLLACSLRSARGGRQLSCQARHQGGESARGMVPVIRRAYWAASARGLILPSLVMMTVGPSRPTPVTIGWRTVPGSLSA